MKKETFNLVIRFLVGAAASLLICAGMIQTEKLTADKPLIQQASGLKGNEVVMTVDGEDVEAWEYLYMTAYTAQSLSYYGITDLTTELGEGFTAADYVTQQAESLVVQQAAIRKWAADTGITLTDEDHSAMQAEKEGYGENLSLMLKVNGITEAQYDQIVGNSALYNRLYAAYCTADGAMRPSDADLTTEAQEHGLMTADVLTVSTDGMDDDAKAEVKALMNDYLLQLVAAEDNAATFAALDLDERITASAGVTYDGCEETTLTTALATVGEGAVSGVIEDGNTLYVAVRRPINLDAVAEIVFGEEMTARITGAQVVHNDSVYNTIDTAAYYTRFSTAQQSLYTKLTSAGN